MAARAKSVCVIARIEICICRQKYTFKFFSIPYRAENEML